MNKKYVHKKSKTAKSNRPLVQFLASVIIFVLVVMISGVNPTFKQIILQYTKTNTDFATLGKMAYEKIEQCFKYYDDIVDIK